MAKIKFYIPVILFLSLTVFMWRGLFLEKKELPSVLIDKQFPPFELETVAGGEFITQEQLPDEMFILNVWASWCLPCLVEHPTLMRLAENNEIPIVGINYRDEQIAAQNWLADNGNPFTTSIMDPTGRFGIDLGVYGAPETYLVDAQGIIRYRHVSVLNEEVWRNDFLPAIAELTSNSE